MNEKNIDVKRAIVDEVASRVDKSAGTVLFEYRGLSVAEMTDLRRKLREVGAELAIYKNTLVNRAVTKLGKDELVEHLTGPNALLFSEDLTSGAKVLTRFARFHGEVVIKAGIFEDRIVDAAGVRTIARLPDRDGMLSMFLSVLNAPIQKFAATVKAVAEKQ